MPKVTVTQLCTYTVMQFYEGEKERKNERAKTLQLGFIILGSITRFIYLYLAFKSGIYKNGITQYKRRSNGRDSDHNSQ